jgi:hypothetical protein
LWIKGLRRRVNASERTCIRVRLLCRSVQPEFVSPSVGPVIASAFRARVIERDAVRERPAPVAGVDRHCAGERFDSRQLKQKELYKKVIAMGVRCSASEQLEG